MLKILKKGSVGFLVSQWQAFLRGQGFLINTTGTFDDETDIATKAFQTKHKLFADGIVGNQTYGKAATLGFELVDISEIEMEFPQRPEFPPLVGNEIKQTIFGPLIFEPAPTPTNPEAIRITNNWEGLNLVRVNIPQLVGIKGANTTGLVAFHKKAVNQLVALWQAWEDAGLLNRVVSYHGAYNARFVRGLAHQKVLSNHAFGTAFDINASFNPLGAEPATHVEEGCVYELVPLAHQHGFFWGGHFLPRKDGMHFEVAKILE